MTLPEGDVLWEPYKHRGEIEMKNLTGMPEYSVEYAMVKDLPHPTREYHLKRKEWEVSPYNPEHDLLGITKDLELLLPEEMRETVDEWCTSFILVELIQQEKKERDA